MSSLRLRLTHVIVEIPATVRLLSVVPLLTLLAATTACSNVLPAASPAPPASRQQSVARILLSPTSTSVPSGGTLQFTAFIQGSSNTEVHWSTTAGTISANGLFSAPTVTSTQTVIVSASTLESSGNLSQPLPVASTSVSVTPLEELRISTQTLRAATKGVSYSEALSSGGGSAPYSWSISSGSLPQGIQLNASTGVISGSTIQTGNFQFTVTVKDATSDQAAQPLLLVVSVTNGPCLSGPPSFSCSTTSTANPGNISPIFTSTAPTATTCSGMCQNSTAYDTTLNPVGTDCITRISDGATFPNGLSVGNLTFSGGDNDIMGSVNETYLGVNAGDVKILHMNTSGNCIQVLNPGVPAMHVAGPFGFSKVVDTRFYYIAKETQLWQGDIKGTVPNETFTPTELVDISAAGVCPGVNWGTFGTPTSGSIMGIKYDDSRFGWSVGPGNAGSADWSFVWDRTLGCASVNFATGQYWAFCASSCGPSTPASGTLSSSGCYGSNGSTGHGIHDSQMSGDGKYMVVTEQITGTSRVPWTKGICAGNTLANQQTIWQIGTSKDQWVHGSTTLTNYGSNAVGHASAGQTSYISDFFAGPNIRSDSDVSTFSVFAPAVTMTDEHCSWPHPLADDSYPWICASDLVTTAQGGVYAPPYLSNVVYAWFPNVAYPPGKAPALFTHTFSCGDNAEATCADGADSIFGSQESIGFATQHGNYFCWASSMLHNLGNDNLGSPRTDGFCVHLQ
jgi:hypothetical protein